MKLPALQDGDVVGVRAASHAGSPFFTTKIDSQSDEGYWIYAPYTDDFRSMIRPGDDVELQRVSGGAVLYYSGTVVSRRQDRVVLLNVARVQFVRRDQRREYVRVATYLDVFLADEAVVGARPTPSADWFKAITRDISGGGVGVFMPSPPAWAQHGTVAWLAMALGEGGEPLIVRAVIRHMRPDDLSDDGTLVGLEFKEITEFQRKQIIRYVLTRQRDLIKKQKAPE